MRAKIRAWRRRQPSRVLYVPVPTYGTTIVANGLRGSRRFGVRMIEVHR